MPRLSFKQKILVALAIAVVGFAILGGVAVPALGNLARTVTDTRSMVSAADTISRAQIAVLTLGDDSRHLDPAEVEAFLERIDGEEERLLDALTRIQETVGDPEAAQAVEEVSDLLTTFCMGLADWVNKRAELGMGSDDGRLAAVARAGADLESSVSLFSSLRNVFYKTRDAEQKYFIHRNPDDLARFRATMGKLKDTYEQLGLGDTAVDGGKTITVAYFDYLDAVGKAAGTAQDMWKLDVFLADALDRLKSSGADAKKAITALLVGAQDGAQAASNRASTTILSGTVAVAALLVLALTWVGVTTGRRIAQTADVLKGMATGEGDLTQFLPQKFVTCSDLWGCQHTECPSHSVADPCWSHVGTLQIGRDNIQCVQLVEGEVEDCESCRVYGANRRLEADEFDRVAHWFNLFVGKVRTMVRQVKDSSDSLAQVAEEMVGSVDGIATRTVEVSGHATDVTGALGEVSTEMKTVDSAVEDAEGTLGVAATAAEQMASTVSEIATNANRASEITHSALDQANAAASRVQDLDSAAQSIGKVTATISEISEQTKLLALNATIEAARAGEAGKGFAVVANEIKELARQTAEATGDIRGKVEAIQSSTTQTISDIGSVTTVIDDVNGIVTSIAAAVEEQSATTREIAENVNRAADGMRDTSGGVSNATERTTRVSEEMEQVTRAMDDVSGGVTRLRGNAEGLASVAENMRGLVGRFKV